MHPILIIAAGVAVAALIGGVTNHLAIKMLFHPRAAWKVRGIRIPFTPGLIPKRKEEIGRSLGRVVADYLVTSHGVTQLLRKPEFQQRLQSGADRLLDTWCADESTVAELVLKYRSGGQALQDRERLTVFLRSIALGGIDRLWSGAGWKNKTLKDLVPDWGDELKAEWAGKASNLLLGELSKQLAGPSGQQVIGSMVRQFTQNAGGFFGALAGMFMDEQKIVGKVQSALLESLHTPSTKAAVGRMIVGRLNEWEEVSLEEWGRRFSADRDTVDVLKQALERSEPWKSWAERIWLLPVGGTLSAYKDQLAAAVPGAIKLVLGLLEANVERIFSALNLPDLVEEQVKHFPVERLEQIILSVSGKEFRAITWLGVLLGGVIGLAQSLLLMWLQRL